MGEFEPLEADEELDRKGSDRPGPDGVLSKEIRG